MSKNNFVYAVCIVLFVVLVTSVTITYLVINEKDRGISDVSKKYYDVIFSNVSIDYESDISVKINNEKDYIHIVIPNLNEFERSSSFAIDVKNIGNISAYVEKMHLSNIISNIDPSKVNVDVSLVKDDIIKGGESKKLIITITYIGKEKIEIPNYEFNINYSFNEVVL